jgi:hypothetical protein
MSDDFEFNLDDALAGLKAQADQAVAGMRDLARCVMAFHSELVDGGMQEGVAMYVTARLPAAILGATMPERGTE